MFKRNTNEQNTVRIPDLYCIKIQICTLNSVQSVVQNAATLCKPQTSGPLLKYYPGIYCLFFRVRQFWW